MTRYYLDRDGWGDETLWRDNGDDDPTALETGPYGLTDQESRPVGVAHGVPAGMDRRRAAGNAVVPAVAEHIGRLIVGMDTKEQAA